MQVGRFVDGHDVTYDEQAGVFSIGGAAVTLDAMRGYAAANQITWASPDTDAWFRNTFTDAVPVVKITNKAGLPRWAIVLIVLGGLALLVGACAVLGSQAPSSDTNVTKNDSKLPPTTVPAVSPTVTADAPAAPAPDPAPDPAPAAAPAPEPAPAPAPAPAPKKTTYKKLSARQFAVVVKDPDSHIGETYEIYGKVTQFDSATGADTFRADTGPKKATPDSLGYVFDYNVNSVLTGNESKLSNVVQDDLFFAKVTVLGSLSYDTQIGGSTTVPQFQIDQIKVYGHAK